jgi:membrane protein
MRRSRERAGQSSRPVPRVIRRAWSFTSATVVSFYHDQGTHHAAALTYYALMSLFPMLLLAVALLGLVGQFPATYNSIVHYLSGVVPATTLAPLNAAVRAALKSKGTALAALAISILAALYGATGYLEAGRRALNVVLDVPPRRSFLQRKLTDILSTLVLLELVLVTLTLMFAGATLAREVLGSEAAAVWRIGRWPAALLSALLVFLFVYVVTPDTTARGWRWSVPGAAVGVALWVLASAGLSAFPANFSSFNVTYGSFAAAIVLLVWLWLTNVALLLGAEVNAELWRRRHPWEFVDP